MQNGLCSSFVALEDKKNEKTLFPQENRKKDEKSISHICLPLTDSLDRNKKVFSSFCGASEC